MLVQRFFCRFLSHNTCTQHENALVGYTYLQYTLYSNQSQGLPRKRSFPRMQRGIPSKRHIPGINKVVAVTSAKGGVGKSTVSVNLALSLARQGKRTGLLDADIFGPSIPRLLNLSTESPRLNQRNQLLPIENYGIRSMSMGYLVGEEAPVVWRGLMVTKAIQQLLWEVDWGELDILVIDFPPGTGDVQLTISQQLPIDGAIIVSTPQDIALVDSIKGMSMFKTVNIPILGMIQNMSLFTCPTCGHCTPIFGSDGVARQCEKHDISLLGDIPLDATICEDSDAGTPTVVARSGPLSDAFQAIALKVALALGLRSNS